ncbi:hypothetical protein BB559_000582 [Furculomyces boomerangus]|uniref:ATPase of the ABC class n=1 Tax=Furculomyces boomerangus TaxID=61424 RepID=A0A2T9Z4R3_9FUNG|nr:hypothetical protein BB559_000582 [Furculomyces boomerangus]
MKRINKDSSSNYKAGKYSRGNEYGSTKKQFRVNRFKNDSISNSDNEFIKQDNIKFSKPISELFKTLNSLDNKQYGAYKCFTGCCYDYGNGMKLIFDHVQSDPFAPPSKVRVLVDNVLKGKFPSDLFNNKSRQALTNGGYNSPRGGTFSIYVPGQQIIESDSVFINKKQQIEVRLSISLPGQGRRIMGKTAINSFSKVLPRIIDKSTIYTNLNDDRITEFVNCNENQDYLRSLLPSKGLVGFIKNDSILPRASGSSSLPMYSENLVKFKTSKELEVTFELLHGTTVVGMGIPSGITVITGGGYHGKSTLMQGLKLGIYNFIQGDGREFVSTVDTAVSIKAEDGRSIKNCDISAFLDNISKNIETSNFSTEDASGSSSMAASIQEMLEVGATALLMDEDTCATNFLIRDHRMQLLVQKSKEPITPLISLARSLYSKFGLSLIIVIGGCGDYLEIADTVICMEYFVPKVVTEKAQEICINNPTNALNEEREYRTSDGNNKIKQRLVSIPSKIVSKKPPRIKSKKVISLFFDSNPKIIKNNETSNPPDNSQLGLTSPKPLDFTLDEFDGITSKDEYDATSELDLSGLDQLVSSSQTRAIAYILRFLGNSVEKDTMNNVCKLIDSKINENGLDWLSDIVWSKFPDGSLSKPRRFEIAMALNRLRLIEAKLIEME